MPASTLLLFRYLLPVLPSIAFSAPSPLLVTAPGEATAFTMTGRNSVNTNL